MRTSDAEKAAVERACAAVVARLMSGEGMTLGGTIWAVFEETRAEAWRRAMLAALAHGASLEGMYAAGVAAGVWPDLPLVPAEGVSGWARSLVEAEFAKHDGAHGAVAAYPLEPWILGCVAFVRRDGERRCVDIAAELSRAKDRSRPAALDAVTAAVLREVAGPAKGNAWGLGDG